MKLKFKYFYLDENSIANSIDNVNESIFRQQYFSAFSCWLTCLSLTNRPKFID